MGTMRSPNYPALGLPDAVKAAQQIWDKERRTPVSMDVVGKAMGYNSISGNVRTKVASLRKYGLLDQNGGNFRLSDLAITILHGQPEEKQQALSIAASRPESFRELFASHADASDDALRAHLLTKKSFSPAGAKQFIKAFRETLSIANPSKSDYSSESTGDNADNIEGEIVTPAKSAASAGGQKVSILENWTLSVPRSVKAELKIYGDVRKEDVTRLKRQIEFLEESFEDAELESV